MIYVIVICVSVPGNPNVGHCEYENGGWTYQTLQECQEREAKWNEVYEHWDPRSPKPHASCYGKEGWQKKD
jgi:hypothetical protein